jgi:hypothetical protein
MRVVRHVSESVKFGGDSFTPEPFFLGFHSPIRFVFQTTRPTLTPPPRSVFAILNHSSGGKGSAASSVYEG